MDCRCTIFQFMHPDLGDMLKINPKDKILGDLLAYPHCMNGETKVRELSTYRQMLASPE